MIGGLCEIVWVVDGSDPSADPMARLLPRLGRVVDTHGLTPGQIAGLLRHEGVSGITAFTDSQLAVASAIATALGLDCNPSHVVERLNDKEAQRSALRAAGIDVPVAVRVPAGADADTVGRLTSDLAFPVVVKPCNGDSSREARAVADSATLRAVFDAPTDRLPDEDFIVEEYLADRDRPADRALADYVSVEMIVQAGVAVPLAVTGKFLPAAPFRETGNFMPHPLGADEAGAVLTLAVDAAEALGVRCGALHTEIKLTPDGPRVIEVNGRVGGGGIDHLFALRHGRSLSELATRVALGQRIDLVAETPRRWSGPFAFEFFVQPPTSAVRLRSMVGTERLNDDQWARTVAVNRSPGDALDWRSGSQGYVLRVGGEAPDRAVLASVPASVLGTVEIHYD